MSSDPEAKLFYGYLQPEEDREHYQNLDHSRDQETAWSATHTKTAHGCVGGIYGYDENLGFFLAVEASLQKAEWDEVVPLTPAHFVVKPGWDEQLRQAANTFKLDITDLQPGWYLVCLYF